jgi:hypothetical protein
VALTESEETGKHELRTVTNGVDGRVLDDKTLVAGQQGLEGSDDSTEVGFCRGKPTGCGTMQRQQMRTCSERGAGDSPSRVLSYVH